MRQLIREHYPDSIEEFRNSDKWFAKPCGRLKVSLRRKTQVTQETPAEVKIILRKFCKHLSWVIIRGKYELADIASMDQRGSWFIIDVDKTYEMTNSKDVWWKSGLSGLDKRQCTVQLTAFADGIPRMRPLLMFRGQGLRIKNSENEHWDKKTYCLISKECFVWWRSYGYLDT